MLLVLSLLACSPSPEAPPAASDAASAAPAAAQRKVRVALNWYPEPEFGGFYEAALSGAYRDAGLDVEILPGGPGAPVLELLASGQAEVAVTGADDLLVRRAKGADAVAILPGFQDSPVGLMAHVPGPTRFEDVKGRVAIEQGSPFQLFVASTYGWDGKVEMVPTTGTLGPFAADPQLVQQAYVTSEPCLAEGQGIAVTFLPGRDAGWNPYASLAAVRSADVGADWVRAFRDASLAGWKAYLADPARANAEIARLNPNMAPTTLDCVTKRQAPYVTGTDGLGVMTQARWDAVAAALTKVGQPVSSAGAWQAPAGAPEPSGVPAETPAPTAP
jgi:NitT/TauT family transport system substrate-binding protein